MSSPTLALSIRQPWAWLIVEGLKDVENRTWWTRFRGPVLIHAAKTMTQADYEACRIFVDGISEIELPYPKQLERGGIVGIATITDCTSDSGSPWFCGPFGFVMDQAKRMPFQPCKGALGFFRPTL